MPFDNGTFKGLSVVPNGDVALRSKPPTPSCGASISPRTAPRRACVTDDVVRNGRPDYRATGASPSFRSGRDARSPSGPSTRTARIAWRRAGRSRRRPPGSDGGVSSCGHGRQRRRFMVDGRFSRPPLRPASGPGHSQRAPLADSQEVAFHVPTERDDERVGVARRRSCRRITSDREAISYPVWSPTGAGWLWKSTERTNIGVVARGGGRSR